MEHGMVNSISKMFCYKKSKKVNTDIEEVEKYPNDWFYMVKRNKNKDDEYWWWNKRTGEVSSEKPETFERESVIYESDSDDDDTDEIIRDYGEWKFMRTTYSENEIKEWWWNPSTEECQFTVPSSIEEIVV